MKVKESETRRKERLAHAASLRTRVVESKKKYNRKKAKAELRKEQD